jgi:hypothetical protein
MQLIPMYDVGDIVRVKNLERLRQDLGWPIQAVCSWVGDMNRYAGGEYRISHCRWFSSQGGHYSYQLEGCGGWWFSEDTFETQELCVGDVQMSYDELMAGTNAGT